jgi:hypothetical protein
MCGAYYIVFWCKQIVGEGEVYDLINSIDVTTDLKERFSEVLIVLSFLQIFRTLVYNV